jgi:hypothetical protein
MLPLYKHSGPALIWVAVVLAIRHDLVESLGPGRDVLMHRQPGPSR